MTKTKNPSPPFLADLDAERKLVRSLGNVLDRSPSPLAVKLNSLGRLAVHIQHQLQEQRPQQPEQAGPGGGPIAAP